MHGIFSFKIYEAYTLSLNNEAAFVIPEWPLST